MVAGIGCSIRRQTSMRSHDTDPKHGAFACSALAIALTACSSAGTPPRPQNSPPAPAAVRDGIAEDVDSQSVTSSLFANWDAFIDPEGSPVLYEWSVGTAPGRTDVLEWTSVGGATRASTSSEEGLPLDQLLYISVRAQDVYGSFSNISSSDGVVLGVPDQPWTQTPRNSEVGQEGLDSTLESAHHIALERYGITWTFARPSVCGRFCNGDWWVIGPIDIVKITPQSSIDKGRIRNGAMINPDPTSVQQGYDNAMFGDAAAAGYDAALNVALDVSTEQPLRLEPGDSLISATSLPRAGTMPQLETCAILTCLAEPPPTDAFRPPYCGDDKACRWLADDLDLTPLARLDKVRAAPHPDDLAHRFERPWLDHVPGWQGRYLHPRLNLPDYGRDIADLVGQAGLVLQLDHDEATKRSLAVHLVQIGIDCYGIVQSGGRFLPDGGSGAGRKFPVLLAGVLLNDEELLRCARESKFAFAEDVQTFFVEETAPGTINHGYGGYDASDIGLAEWGQRHADDPRLDRKPWTTDAFRRCCSANAWTGFVLATHIMGQREAWDHDALFTYVDRYMQIEERGAWTRSWSPFAERMWDRYRGDY